MGSDQSQPVAGHDDHEGCEGGGDHGHSHGGHGHSHGGHGHSHGAAAAAAENPNALNESGLGRLHMAAFTRNMPALQAALQMKGINPNLRDSSGATPLFYACVKHPRLSATARDDAAFAQALVAGGADPMAREDGLGDTPLIVAAREGLVEVVRLLAYLPSVDLNVKNRQGKTAEAVADEAKSFSVLEVLRDAAAARGVELSVAVSMPMLPEGAMMPPQQEDIHED